jgi:ABC-type glycerol-3-phosphate transport system substrate-binding protein
MARSFRRRRRWSAPLLLALVTALLGGCRWLPQPPVNLQVTISIAGNDRVSQLSLRRLASAMVSDYMAVNPGVTLHLRFLPEADVLPALRARSSLGAGPDLVIAGASPTHALFREGLLRPPAIPLSRLAPFRLRFLSSFLQPEGLAAIPMLVQPVLACHDRRRIQQLPVRLDDLPRLAASGHRIGLSLTATELLWTTSGFEAQQPLLRLMAPTPERVVLSEPERQGLIRWLEWLYRANVEPNLQFMDNSELLLRRLETGSLDWISCPGTAISRLRQSMGANLGISTLPVGVDGQPSKPLARLVLLGFGRDSNAAERRAAEKFALFAINEYSQNNLMVRALGNMPVNGNVIVPVKEMPELDPLQISLDHSVVLDFRGGIGLARKADPLRNLLKETVYGQAAPEAVLAGIEDLGQSTRSAAP